MSVDTKGAYYVTPREYWEVLAVEMAIKEARTVANGVRQDRRTRGTAWGAYCLRLDAELRTSQYLRMAPTARTVPEAMEERELDDWVDRKGRSCC